MHIDNDFEIQCNVNTHISQDITYMIMNTHLFYMHIFEPKTYIFVFFFMFSISAKLC